MHHLVARTEYQSRYSIVAELGSCVGVSVRESRWLTRCEISVHAEKRVKSPKAVSIAMFAVGPTETSIVRPGVLGPSAVKKALEDA